MDPISVPSLVESATILAAVAALFALPVAWWSYKADEARSRQALIDGVSNILTALEPEMEIVASYARGENGEGYPPHGDESATYKYYFDNYTDWANPRRGLIPLVCPAMVSLATSRFAAQVAPLIRPFAILNSAIGALATTERSRSDFVAQNAALMGKMTRVWTEPDHPPEGQEQEGFVAQMFFYNYEIHAQIIGYAGSKGENTLFRAHAGARTAVDAFTGTWRRSLPRGVWWHPLVDVISWGLILAAVVTFGLWLQEMLHPLPVALWHLMRR